MTSIEQHQQLLGTVNSANPDVNSAAATINQYTELCKSGQISTVEYAQLLRDIQHTININAAAIEQQNLNTLNTVINGLIDIAGAV